jgi:hypothetical protein
VLLNGWQVHKDHPSKRVRKRIAWEVSPVRSMYAGAVWAMWKFYRQNKPLQDKADKLLQDIYATFGWKTRLLAPLLGSFAYFTLKKEEQRLSAGWIYEPSCFYEQNLEAQALEQSNSFS